MTDIYITISTLAGPLKCKVDKIEYPDKSVFASSGPVTGKSSFDLGGALSALRDALEEHHYELVLTAKGEPCIKCGSTNTRSNTDGVRCDDCFSYYPRDGSASQASKA